MANNTSTFTLKLKSEGMEQVQQGSKQIRENLEGAQKAASKVARSAAAQPTGRAGASAGVFTGSEVEEYNRASGAAGKAGGTARDFADQARGLGGLVRLYATVAANAFAAAAAFGALSRAMDTTNMVKGLDQLGASSGVALGNLSKRLFLATDGAVSLREAMEATAKATGAGLNSDQVLKLGEVAKKASQTLGVNMTDALSRLSRGVTKLEPELLDELGIFVKIDDAASKYALSVGKSTAALTDFERRQAFANAVIDQGTKKFGEVNIDINPYTKLAATFQNLTQTLLEFVNKGLAPIAQIFADNSVLLGAAFAFIATKVLKMAIPALGEWQGQLVKTAEIAKDKAQSINRAFGEAWVERWETRLKLPELRAGVKTATEELKKVGLPAGMTKNVEAGYAALLRGEELSKTQVTATNRAITSKRKEIEALGDVQDRQGKKQKAALEKEINQLERLIALSKQRQVLESAEKKIETKAQSTSFFSGDAARDRTARAASTTAIALGELAAVPGKTMEKGFGDAMKNMKANLEKQGVGFVKRWSTLAVGALASATTAIGTFVASIQMWIGVFMAVGFAIYGALKYFSATKKESELTSEAMTRLDDASKSARLTLEKLAMSKDPLESLNVQTIQARANAIKELGDSAALAVKRAFDELSKMNAGDQILNFVSKLWGGDVQTRLAEGLSDSIKNAFKLAEDTQLTAESKKSIEAVVGASIESANLTDIIKKLAASGDTEKLKQVVKIVEAMGNAAAVSAAKGTELKDSFGKVTTGLQEFNRSILPTDNLSKLAQDSAVAAQKLGLALNDPVQALTAMRDVSNSVDMLSIFPPEVASTLMGYNKELTLLAERSITAKNQTKEYDKELNNLNEELSALNKLMSTSKGVVTKEEIDRAEELRSKIASIENKKVSIKAEISSDTDKIKGVFDQAVRGSLIQSADLMAARLAAEMNKSRSAVMGTIAGLLGDSAGAIRLRAQLEKQAVDANVEVAQQSFNLATRMEELKIEMERKRLQDEKFNLMSSRDPQGQADRNKRIEAIDRSLQNLDKLEGVIKSGFRGPSSQQLARQGATPEMVAARQRSEAFGVTLAGAREQKRAIDIKAGAEETRSDLQQSQKDFQLTVDRANVEKERLNTLSNIYGIENLTLLNKKLAQENSAQELADTKQRNELQASVVEKAKLYTDALINASKTGQALSADEKKAFADSINNAQAEVNRFNQSVELRKKSKDLADELLRIDSNTASEQKRLDLQNERIGLAEDLKQISLDTAKAEFERFNSIGALSEEYAAKRIGEMAKEAQQLQRNRQLQQASAQKALQDLQAQAQARKAVAGGMDPAEAELLLEASLAKNTALYDDRVRNINAANTAAERSIEIETSKALRTAETNKLLDEQKQRTAQIAEVGTLLTSVFGDSANALIGVVNALGDMTIAQETYNSKLNEQYEIMDQSRAIMDDPTKSAKQREDAAEAYAKAQKEVGKIEKQNSKDQLNNNIKLVSATKSMFKEKTAAHKALSAVEKGMHVYRMLMLGKEVAAQAMATAKNFASSIKEMIAAGGVAVANQGKGDPYTAFARMAAMAAGIAALISSVGGSGGPQAPGGSSAADRQETQGTGMTWKDGQKVETGGGVFGDPEAKSDAIRKSLERIKETGIEGITYDNQMVRLLTSIDKSIGKAALGLFSARGLRGGTAFGTQEGTQSGKGLLGTGLFSSKTTSQITDSGLIIKGTFRQLSGAIDGAVVQLYEDVTMTKKKWYGSTKSWTQRSTQDLPEALQYINEVFSYSTDLFIDLGSQLGIGASSIMAGLDSLGSIDFEASLRGLKGEEFENALQAIISNQLARASDTLFGPLIQKYRQFGEDSTETVIRVLDGNRKVEDALFSIGKTSIDAAVRVKYANILLTETASEDGPFGLFTRTVTTTRRLTEHEFKLLSIAITESLIEAAGGLDEFISQTNFFAENFLTEAERLAPVQERLTQQMSELGLSGIDTREEFKQLVLGLDLTNASQREMYSRLMELAPAFAMVYEAAEDATMSVKEFSKKVFSSEVDILKTQASILEKNKDFDGAYRKSQEATTLIRQAELAEIEKLPEAQRNVIKYQTQYKWSLEDIASAADLAEKKNRALVESYNENIRIQQAFVSYLDEAFGLLNQALNLENKGVNTAYAKQVERTIKLQDIQFKYAGQENEVRRRVITSLQKYVWALQDLQEAETKYLNSITTLSEAINREVAKIDNSVDYLTTALGMVTQALRLEAKGAPDSAYIKNIERTIKLQDIQRQYASEETGTRARVITSLQKYIWALEDEEEARSQYMSALSALSDALQTEIGKLEREVQSFDRVLGMITQALETRGTSADLALSKSISRSMQLQDIEKEFAGGDQIRKASVIGVQNYIWALEDEKEAKDKYIDALNAQVAAAEREISKLEELVASYDKLLDQKARIAELTAANSTMAKTISRERELKELRKGVSDDIATALVRNQEYIWALEDEQDLKEKLIEQRDRERDAIQGTIDSLGDAIESLKDYSNSLLLSENLTTLTPEEQYLQARKTFEEVMTTARTPGMDEAGRAKQMEAAAKLPEVSNAFLELSRTLFASSSNYMADFNLVRMAIDQTSAGLGEQLTEAEKQLKALEESTSFLESIEEATKTTAELLVEYAAAQERTATAASAADTMSTEQITQLKDVAESQISNLNAQIENTNAILETLTEKTLTYEEAAKEARAAGAIYAQASAASAKALEDTNGTLSENAIKDYLESRKEALNQIEVLNKQLTALQNIEKELTGTVTLAQATANFQTAGNNLTAAQANTGTALTAVSQDVNATTIQEALSFRGVLTAQAIAFENELKVLQNIENEIKGMLTYEQAKTAYQTAASEYGAAKDATAAALATVVQDVNTTTIAQALAERERSLRQIEADKALIEGINRVEANTFGVYQSQQAHFQSLITNPQQVNVGVNVAGLLQTIATNTASTIDTLNEVKQVVKDGTEVTITSNADAVQTQTEAFVEAVAEIADNWSERTVPEFLVRSGEVRMEA